MKKSIILAAAIMMLMAAQAWAVDRYEFLVPGGEYLGEVYILDPSRTLTVFWNITGIDVSAVAVVLGPNGPDTYYYGCAYFYLHNVVLECSGDGITWKKLW